MRRASRYIRVVQPLLRQLGVEQEVLDAGFVRFPGHVVRWGDAEAAAVVRRRHQRALVGVPCVAAHLRRHPAKTSQMSWCGD